MLSAPNMLDSCSSWSLPDTWLRVASCLLPGTTVVLPEPLLLLLDGAYVCLLVDELYRELDDAWVLLPRPLLLLGGAWVPRDESRC